MKKEFQKDETLVLTEEVAVCRDFDVKWLHQVIRSSGMIAGSWGYHKPTEIIKDQVLRFRVSGHHHKGFVYICLHGNDTFTIFLTNLKDVIKLRLDGIYIDMLIDTLDEYIEKIPCYKW
ncbi:hypothetical protein [Carboxylicivirga sp. RSCT41]|uniref:hypothetical protein n=1 Tax=Carboxylicivirga agarovorans TaxID=3417570 RepID=UPI003D3371F2